MNTLLRFSRETCSYAKKKKIGFCEKTHCYDCDACCASAIEYAKKHTSEDNDEFIKNHYHLTDFFLSVRKEQYLGK